MTALMRDGLKTLLSGSLLDSAHAGLLLQRGLPEWENNNDNTKPQKQNLLNKISNISTPSQKSLYYKAYERWLTYTADETRFAFTAAKIVGRLYTGLSSATALETGMTTHHTYGMPMIAGSSIKGAVSAFAEQIGVEANICAVLFGNDEDGVNESGKNEASSGAVIWHDAWWIPSGSLKPFVGEIITTHHQEYYNGNQPEADEMESPIPNQQIATHGSFYFVVEGVTQAWAKFANELLYQMLQQQGLGSKTASGYGYFDENNKDVMDHIRQKQKQLIRKEAEKKAKQGNLADKIQYFADNDLEQDLVTSLTKGKNKFFQDCNLNKDNEEDMKKLVHTILSIEKCKQWYESWEGQEGNKDKAHKFIKKYI